MRRLLPLLAAAAIVAVLGLSARAQAGPDCTSQFCIYVGSVTVALPPSFIRNADLELGNNGDWQIWSSDDQQPITTNHPIIRAHSGQSLVRMGGHLTQTTIISQAILLPSVPDRYVLELNYWYFTDGPLLECFADRLNEAHVGVVESNGRSIAREHRLCQLGNTPAWIQTGVSITEFAGRPVTIVIRTNTAGDYPGEFYLDDLSLRVYCEVCRAASTVSSQQRSPISYPPHPTPRDSTLRIEIAHLFVID